MKWPKTTLGEIFEIARGGSPRPIDKFITDDLDGYNWIMIGDAIDGSKYIATTKKRIRREGLKKSRMVNVGDFLLTNSMSFGRPYILKTSGCIHDGWLVLSPKDSNVHRDFFYYLLGSDVLYSEFSKRAAGAVVKNLNTDLVRNVDVVLPPLAEQKRIAAILDAADALRAKRREALAQLDSLLQSTFDDLFVAGRSFPSVCLEDVTTRITDGTHLTPTFLDAGVPFIFVKNVRNGKIDFTTDKYISEKEHEDLFRRCPIEEGDVLYTSVGATYGHAALVG